MLIDNRYGHIDKHNGTPVTGVSEATKATNHVAPHKFGDRPMTKILNLLDRSALTLINVLVLAGMPLAAFALATNAL
jgi:hypothetical protein